ncbi:OmpH family outer membrane protein [Polaribacter sp. L3A8]|uniref:OmpH family outer membrane protein n=1 Tax=Polaribacter sp. L3A8 TaxID=2686361 RepID=UPI0018EF20A1|nr:OmpH family outer membrane protein [Polaribacter sp. L3A8]
MKSKIIFIAIALLSTISIAQSKVGTVDSEYILSLMPETKIVLERSQNYGAKLDSSFNIKVKTYQTKVDAFKKNEKTLGELAKQGAYKELAELEADIKKYQQNGNKLMQLKQDELMRPLYKKLSEAITTVSKAGKYTQILTVSGNDFAYIDNNFDITKLVLNNLGIVMPTETEE